MSDETEAKPHEEMTLYEVYAAWESSLNDCMREVHLMREYLYQLKQTEKILNVHVNVTPVFPNPNPGYRVAGNFNYQGGYVQSDGTVVYPVTQGQTMVAQMPMPYSILTPNVVGIDQALASFPKNTEQWLEAVKKRKAELDTSVQTIINLGVLKKAKEQQR